MISVELQNDASSDERNFSNENQNCSNEEQNDNGSESKRDQNDSKLDETGCGCWSITKQCIKYCCMVILYILFPIILSPFLLLIWIILPFLCFFSNNMYHASLTVLEEVLWLLDLEGSNFKKCSDCISTKI